MRPWSQIIPKYTWAFVLLLLHYYVKHLMSMNKNQECEITWSGAEHRYNWMEDSFYDMLIITITNEKCGESYVFVSMHLINPYLFVGLYLRILPTFS